MVAPISVTTPESGWKQAGVGPEIYKRAKISSIIEDRLGSMKTHTKILETMDHHRKSLTTKECCLKSLIIKNEIGWNANLKGPEFAWNRHHV